MIDSGRHWLLHLFRSLMKKMSWLRGGVIQSERYLSSELWTVLDERVSANASAYGVGMLRRHGRMRIILWRSFHYGSDRSCGFI